MYRARLLTLIFFVLIFLANAMPYPPGPVDPDEKPHDPTPVLFFGPANEAIYRQDILQDQEYEFTPSIQRINFVGTIYRIGNPAGNCCVFWRADYLQFVLHGTHVVDIDPPQGIHWGYCMTERVCWIKYGGEPGPDM